MRSDYWTDSIFAWTEYSGVMLTDEQAVCLADSVERYFGTDSGTLEGNIRHGAEKCGLELTDEQVASLAEDVQISGENYGLFTGAPDAPKPAPPEPHKPKPRRKRTKEEIAESNRKFDEFFVSFFADLGAELRKRDMI